MIAEGIPFYFPANQIAEATIACLFEAGLLVDGVEATWRNRPEEGRTVVYLTRRGMQRFKPNFDPSPITQFDFNPLFCPWREPEFEREYLEPKGIRIDIRHDWAWRIWYDPNGHGEDFAAMLAQEWNGADSGEITEDELMELIYACKGQETFVVVGSDADTP